MARHQEGQLCRSQLRTRFSARTGVRPRPVLAGEADFTSITRLDEAHRPDIQAGGSADNRHSGPALRRFGVDENVGAGAMKVRTQAGSVTLLGPQPPVARVLDLLCVDECSRSGAEQRVRLARTPARTVADGRLGGRTTSRSDEPGLFSAERAGSHATAGRPLLKPSGTHHLSGRYPIRHDQEQLFPPLAGRIQRSAARTGPRTAPPSRRA